MPLVAVAPVVLRLQRVRPRVAEGERIALVVVVRLVERERVVRPGTGAGESAEPPELGGDAVVAATWPCSGPRSACRCRWCRPAPRPGAPGRAEHGSLRVDEAGEVIGPRVGVAEPSRRGPRASSRSYPTVAVKVRGFSKSLSNTNTSGLERPTRSGVGQQVAVGRRRPEERAERAVAEEGLPAGAVGAPAAGQVEARDAGVVEARVGPDHLLAVALHVLREAEPRLEHLVVRRDRAVAGELERARRVGDRLADERRVEELGRSA